jgi:hypothetical protein
MHVRNKNLIQIIILLIVSVTIWRIAFSQYQDSLSSFQPQRDWLVIPPTIESISNSHTSLEPEEALLLDEGTRHASYFINRNQEILGTQNDKILHFVQISDIHVSMFTRKGGLSHLEAILYNEIPLIAPDLVLATGDLTDGKAAHFLTSHQQENEWIAYHNVLKESRVMRRNQGLFYMDQRGNHDCWNVASFSSAVNYFKYEFVNVFDFLGGILLSKKRGIFTQLKKNLGNIHLLH